MMVEGGSPEFMWLSFGTKEPWMELEDKNGTLNVSSIAEECGLLPTTLKLGEVSAGQGITIDSLRSALRREGDPIGDSKLTAVAVGVDAETPGLTNQEWLKQELPTLELRFRTPSHQEKTWHYPQSMKDWKSFQDNVLQYVTTLVSISVCLTPNGTEYRF